MKKQLKILGKVIGLLLLLFLWSYIPMLIFNLNYDNFSEKARIIYNFICDIIFLLFIIFIYRKDLKNNFKSFFSDFFNNIEISFKYWLIGFGIMVVSNLLITLINNGGIASNEESVRNLIDMAPLYMIFSVSLYAPFTEELIFRKGFKEIFHTNKLIYIIMSGFTFGALHVVGSISTVKDLLYLIPYCSLGFTFAYTYYKTDNIFSTITMHAFHNTMAIIIYLVSGLL